MQHVRQYTLVILIMACCISAHARTIRVAQDGSGDYTVIQMGLDSTAPGDTLSIGPGRYVDHQSFTLPGWSWAVEVYAYIRHGNLAIVGDGAGDVIIGPEEPTWDVNYFSPKGIVCVEVDGVVDLSGVSVANCDEGLHFGGLDSIGIDGVCVSQCRTGALVGPMMGVALTQCHFHNNGSRGVFFTGAAQASVERCEFWGNEYALSIGNGAEDIKISECSIMSGSIGISVFSASGVSVHDSCIEDVNIGLSMDGSSHSVVGNVFKSNNYCIRIKSPISEATVRNNVLYGGSYATVVYAGPTATVSMSKNDIIRRGSASVRVEGYVIEPARVIDMTGNYWGTTSADSISSWIIDGNDEENSFGFVVFEPFSPVPLPDEKKSLGDVKRMFR